MPNWNDVLHEVQEYQQQAQGALDLIRRKYLLKLREYRGRNIIAYYSGWLSKPSVAQTEINDEDKNGFMMAVHKLDKKQGLDLILHTPGGDIASTQSIVHYLHKMFDRDMCAIVPQIAMSAGTMIACSCREILMGKHSNLGPIDPQIRGIAASAVKKEFQRACREVQKDPRKIPIWQQIIGQYRPTFLSQYENAVRWSNDFVRDQLAAVMFKGDTDAKKKARNITHSLSDFATNKTHARHIHADDCKAMGLKILEIESDDTLQDLILTVHHCYTHVFMNSPAFKIIENHNGVAIIKQQQVQVVAGTQLLRPSGDAQPLGVFPQPSA